MNPIFAISPVDGRYYSKTERLSDYFSEFAFIHYRVRVEIEYFIALCEIPLPQLASVNTAAFPLLRKIYINFSEEDAEEIKDIEKTTNHDVKAVEYFLKRQFDAKGISGNREFIHFGLTSQDINNTSVPMSMKDCHEEVLLPMYEKIYAIVAEKAEEWKTVPMLAHTHGQPASPTALGKELQVFAYRLRQQIDLFKTATAVQ